MAEPHPAHIFPPARTRVVTPRLQLRMPTEPELVELCEVAAGPVHDPAEMPFAQPWSDAPPDGTRVHARSRGPRAPGGTSRERALETRYRIDRPTWQARRRDDIELHGIDEDLRALVGLDA